MKKILLSIMVLFLLAINIAAQQGGYALQFDGTDDQVNCGNSSSFYMNGGSAITIEAWINTKNINQDWQAIAGKQIPYNGVYSIIIESNSKKVALYLNLGGNWLSRVTSSTELEQDKWYHVAATYNGSTAKMYINGKLDNSAACSGTITDDLSVSFFIGKNNSVCFNGYLDEIRVWNIARTEAEIKANMYKEIGTDDHLKAYYKMSDGTGTSLTDNSGNSNTGTLANGPQWKLSGCFAGSRQALDFDGTDDYVYKNPSSPSLMITGDLTIDCWIKYNSLRFPNQQLVMQGYGNRDGNASENILYLFYITNNKNLGGFWEYGTGTNVQKTSSVPAPINSGEWHHIALVRNSATKKVKFLVDGLQLGTEQNYNYDPEDGSGSPFSIAAEYDIYNNYPTKFFDGSMDEIRVWNRVLPDSEIRENMTKTLAGNETGLVAYYRFDQLDGVTLYDLTSNVNHATLVNMDPATDWFASNAFNTWLGGESNAWSASANWSNGVPAAAQSAGIYNWSSSLPNVTTYLPVLPTTVSINNLLVPSGVSASGNVNLTATGSVFLGSNLNLSSASLNTARDLVIESGKTLTIPTAGQFTVSNTLTNSAGNSGLVIESDGSLIHNSNSVASTVKREITGSSTLTLNKYHFVSIPTQYASPTSNLFLDSYLYKLDPTQLNPDNNYGKWIGLGTSTTTPLTLNQGYMIYYPNTSKTYTFEGNLNNGDYTYSLTGHSGAYVYTFNLVPNPYPSAIVWNTGDSGKWPTSTGVGGSCYIWNATSGNYSTISSGVSSYIPAGQAFMTLVTNHALPTLSVNNTARTHSTQAFYKSVTENENQLVVKATSNNYADETVIAFREDATETFDLQVDGMKLTGLEEAPQLYTLSENEKYSINHLPVFEGQKIVPMNFETQFTGEVTLTFSNIESFETSVNIYLQDLISNQTINLRSQPSYTFSHNPQNAANRFNLVFGGTIGIEEPTAQTSEMWISGKTLYINTPEKAGQPALLEVFDASGKVLTSRKVTLDELTTFELKQQGMIVVRLTTADDVLTTKGILMR